MKKFYKFLCIFELILGVIALLYIFNYASYKKLHWILWIVIIFVWTIGLLKSLKLNELLRDYGDNEKENLYRKIDDLSKEINILKEKLILGDQDNSKTINKNEKISL